MGNESKNVHLGLTRIEKLLSLLGRPQDRYRIVHVAGTNGKGSTCAMIERGLRQAGHRTGLFISPHLVQPTERIQIDGEPITEQEFASAFDAVHQAAERLVAHGETDQHATYFECVTAMAMLVFAQRGVEWAVLETGLGGRLDATNVVTPELSVITPIDFDHEKFLGTTLAQIAGEKAGILKPQRPAVWAVQHAEAERVLAGRAEELHCPVSKAAEWTVKDLEVNADGSLFHLQGPVELNIECPLIGEHQVDNVRTAVAALHRLGLNPEAIEKSIAMTRWPGRLELIRRRPDLFLDGAHNPAGARALAHYIQQFHAGRRVWMIFAAMRDKDLRHIGPVLFPLASELVFTQPADFPRAFPPEELRAESGETRAILAATAQEALNLVLRRAASDDVIFVTGSLYLVGEVRGLLVSA